MAELEKIRQLERQLQASGIDTYLILSREDSDCVLPLLLPAHVVAQTAFFFRPDGRHLVLTGATDAQAYKDFGIFEIIETQGDFALSLKTILERLDPQTLALNISENDHLADGLTVGQYQLLEELLGKDRLAEIEVSSEPMIGKLRSCKSEYEIQMIRTAVEKTCRIYEQVAGQIRIGMSETQIGQLFVEGMREEGVVNAFGSPYSYPLICINRCGLNHREPSAENILKEHDILICDFSVVHNGYCSDIARSFYALGADESSAPADVQQAFDTTVRAVSAILEGIRPGMAGYEVDRLGREVIEQAGYPTIRHAAGHQLGMQVHDGGTSLSPKRADRPASLKPVEASEVYAIEPTVIQDEGRPSFIVEEDIVIREDRIEVLSDRQLELYYIDTQLEEKL